MKLECEVQGSIGVVGRSLSQVRNRSGVVELPMAAIVTGAPACELVPEEHPRPARISLYFLKRAARGR